MATPTGQTARQPEDRPLAMCFIALVHLWLGNVAISQLLPFPLQKASTWLLQMVLAKLCGFSAWLRTKDILNNLSPF
jgi:hypothetical protein